MGLRRVSGLGMALGLAWPVDQCSCQPHPSFVAPKPFHTPPARGPPLPPGAAGLARKRPRCGGLWASQPTGDEWNSPSLPLRLRDRLDEIREESSTRARSEWLVQLGDAYARDDRAKIPPGLANAAQRVPGCVSEVFVIANVESVGTLQLVSVHGTADARLSRGILALLADSLTGESPSTVLSLDSKEIARALGLPAGLTESRINGLGNILSVIQGQVRAQLGGNRPLDRPPLSAQAGSNPSTTPVLPPQEGRYEGRSWTSAHGEVAVLLSGGVDSSVALRLLQEEGHKLRAFYLKIWLEDELAHLGECPWEEDLEYARAVCEQAGVPLEVVPLQREYWDHVVAYTVEEAHEGRTPNPDVMCNSRIKFGMFYEYVGRHFRSVATGHYARVERDAAAAAGGRTRLLRSADTFKDQTYFLCALTQEQLRRAVFPVGGYTKEQIRDLARRFDLPTKDRKDSQGICFLGKLKFDDFLRHYLGESEGPVIDYHTGQRIGTHRGLWFHTIGQRKGIGPVLDPHVIHRGPWYVVAKDVPGNKLAVTNDYSAVDGPRGSFQVEALKWIAGAPPPELALDGKLSLSVKTRHGPKMQACVLELSTDGCQDVGLVRLAEKDSGLAAGQFAAFYLGEECLGSGVIAGTEFVLGSPQAGSGGTHVRLGALQGQVGSQVELRVGSRTSRAEGHPPGLPV